MKTASDFSFIQLSNSRAGCSRDIIRRGAEQLGWELNELFEKTLLAMRASEKYIEEKMNEC